MTMLPALIPTEAYTTPPAPLTPNAPVQSGRPVIVSAVAQNDPLSGVPEIALEIQANQAFNIIGAVDASFETGIGTATAVTACIIARTTAQHLDGTHSLAVIATTGGAMEVEQGPYTVTAGDLYTFTASYRAGGTGRTATMKVKWYNGGSFISTTAGTGVSDNSSSWGTAEPFVAVTAPAGATLAYIVHDFSGSVAQIVSPTGLSVTPTGATGSTAWKYEVTATNASGETPPSSVVGITNGVSSLNGTTYNALAWTAVSGATGYNIYRGRQAVCADLVTDFPNCAALITAFATCADVLAYVRTPTLVATSGTNSYHDTGAARTTTVPPTVNTTGETHYIDEVGLFFGVASSWVPDVFGNLLVIRSDGNYVLGASPLFPYIVLGSDGVATVIDRTAPYGESVSYVALALTGGAKSISSIPSTPVTMFEAPDTLALYHRLGWAKKQDSTKTLLKWIAGIGQMIQALSSVSTDSYDLDGNVAPSWSAALDITRCPTAVLPWLAQFNGTRVDPTTRDDQQRYTIVNAAGMQRGTVGAIIAAANQYLITGYSATISERDTSPYHLTVDIPSAGVSGTSTCESVNLAYPNCAAVLAGFADCADVWNATAPITAAVDAAVPAGLVATISYI